MIYLILILLSLAYAAIICGQPGFLNIDCGKDKDYSGFSATGLIYTSDFDYIDTGEIHRISNKYYDSRLKTKWLDARSFPIGIRNCYTLKSVRQGKKYMLRAGFHYGDYDGKNLPPVFDLYLGIHYWATHRISNASRTFQAEALFVTTSNSIQVCLVNTGLGTPFISAIDLRPLRDSIYPQVNNSQTLILEVRLNLGASYNPDSAVVLPVSYPIDPYDREWNPYGQLNWNTVETTSTVMTNDSYDIPSVVLANAVSPVNGLNLNITWSLKDTTSFECHLLLHFAELQVLNETDNRNITIFINEEMHDSVSPEYLLLSTIYIPWTLQHSDSLAVSLSKGIRSTLPPILNALQIYRSMNISESETNTEDVAAIRTLKVQYQLLKNWMGDPCVPKRFIWDGLNCSYTNDAPRITGLNLSSSGLNGEIPASLLNLTHLEFLDLSWNGLTGVIPNFLEAYTLLKLLDLTGNKLHGFIPKVLLDKSSSGLLTLRIENNPELCYSLDSCRNEKKRKTKVIVVATIVPVVVMLLFVLGAILAVKKRNSESSVTREEDGHIIKQNGKGLLQSPLVDSETKKYTFAELKGITGNFHKEIGKGGFGTVYYGVVGNNGRVAVKILSRGSSQGSREFQAEVEVLSRIHHRNLVSLVGYCSDVNHLALLYEYISEGSLHDHLSGKSCNEYMLSWKNRLRIAIGAAQGLEYLHHFCKPVVIHRDVKTRNILLTKEFDAKIADLGLSKIVKTDGLTHVSTRVAGTPGYLDPEYYNTNKLTEKSDVHSFGVVLLELLTGQPPVIEIQEEDENVPIGKWVQPFLERGEIKEIVDKRLQQDYEISSMWKMVEIALVCLSDRSIHRPTMTEVLTRLKECLELGMPHESSLPGNHNPGTHLNNSLGIVPLEESFLTYPSAR